MVEGKFEKSGCANDVLVKSFFGLVTNLKIRYSFNNNFEMFEFSSLIYFH